MSTDDLEIESETSDLTELFTGDAVAPVDGEVTAAPPLIVRPDPIIRGKIDKHGVALGTGRRKTSVARVRVIDGDGKILVNGRQMTEYFTLERDQRNIEAPLRKTDMFGKVNVMATVQGGGPTGQAGAIMLGIARALQAKNPVLHPLLSEDGFLTRDGRMVERKKYGRKKARRSFQFSKR